MWLNPGDNPVFKDLATIYGIFIIIDYMIFDQYGKSLKYQMNPISGNSLQSIFYSFLAVALFLGISYISAFVLQAAQPLLEGNFIVSYLKIFAQLTPKLIGGSFLTYVAWVIVVPIVETRLFFGRLYDLLGIGSGNRVDKLNDTVTWAKIVIISLAFTYFHLKVRGFSNNVGLMGTFFFAVISLGLVIITKELEPARNFHILWNGMITYKTLNP